MKDALPQLGAKRFDFLVNSAGNSYRNMPFEAATEEELESISTSISNGVFFLTLNLLPLFNDGGGLLSRRPAKVQ